MPHPHHAQRELAQSLAGLVSSTSGETQPQSPSEVGQPQLPHRDDPETRFAESVQRLALERKRSHSSPVDALLSVRRDVRLTLEESPLPVESRQKLLLLATDVAVDVLLPPLGSKGVGEN